MRKLAATISETPMVRSTSKSLILIALCVFSSFVSSCTQSPTSSTVVTFDDPDLTFRIDEYLFGAPVANRHEVTLVASDEDDEDTLIFKGFGGGTPSIKKISATNYAITYQHGLRYELHTEKDYYLLDDEGQFSLSALLFRVDQEW